MKYLNLTFLFFILWSCSSSEVTDIEIPKENFNPIPCMIDNSGDVLYLNLGKSTYAGQQGLFYPDEDKIILNDGSQIENYYRDTLGIKYYSPLRPESIGSAPTGWCSWYYYFKEITAGEVLINTEWLRNNLLDYGLKYIQIDDGWMKEIGEENGYKPSDWNNANGKFPEGMKCLADKIRNAGFSPGLWLSPQGQSDPMMLEEWPKTFMKNPVQGNDISGFWGRYLIDPSAEQSHEYLTDLFKRLANWGYDYFKIDGQPPVFEEYVKQQKWMENPGDPEKLYRKTLFTIRKAVGPDSYLLGCWGTPLEGAGIFDGARTGGDTGFNGNWYEVGLRSTLKFLFLNNIVWHSDPDVLLVRDPIPINQARLWATFQALSGQVCMLSDRMPDLSEPRVDILKKTLPTIPVMPVELYPQKKLKNIWDLKISHLEQDYDVVGVFNFVNSETNQKLLLWEELGIPAETVCHVFDFWDQQYLGAWPGGYFTKVSPGSVKLFAIKPVESGPQLISTSRHISQGWIDLLSLEYNDKNISGVSKLIKNDPYTLHFAFPPGKKYELTKVKCKIDHDIQNHGNWAELILYPENTEELSWEVGFTEIIETGYNICEPGSPLNAAMVNPDKVMISWYQPPPLSGSLIYRDGKILGFTPVGEAIVEIDSQKSFQLEVRTVGSNGIPYQEPQTINIHLKDLIPENISLLEMETDREYQEGPGPVDRRFFLYRKNHRLEYGFPASQIKINGRSFANGLATQANSDFIFNLDSCFSAFTCIVGVDDLTSVGSVVFKIFGDDELKFMSGIMRSGSPGIPVNISVEDINQLRLIVEDSGDGIDGDLANWADPVLWR